jgi:hypothetical protein
VDTARMTSLLWLVGAGPIVPNPEGISYASYRANSTPNNLQNNSRASPDQNFSVSSDCQL